MKKTILCLSALALCLTATSSFANPVGPTLTVTKDTLDTLPANVKNALQDLVKTDEENKNISKCQDVLWHQDSLLVTAKCTNNSNDTSKTSFQFASETALDQTIPLVNINGNIVSRKTDDSLNKDQSGTELSPGGTWLNDCSSAKSVMMTVASATYDVRTTDSYEKDTYPGVIARCANTPGDWLYALPADKEGHVPYGYSYKWNPTGQLTNCKIDSESKGQILCK
mgnify:CR=1 FL=1|tara:strand:+ start:653 stop:1327 length:675 start_codon:yes stop_codon:yes gene_type:complete